MNINEPLRSPGYAAARRDSKGQLQVGGSSKEGCKYLIDNFGGIMRLNNDFDSF